jgi:hypothetical protein
MYIKTESERIEDFWRSYSSIEDRNLLANAKDCANMMRTYAKQLQKCVEYFEYLSARFVVWEVQVLQSMHSVTESVVKGDPVGLYASADRFNQDWVKYMRMARVATALKSRIDVLRKAERELERIATMITEEQKAEQLRQCLQESKIAYFAVKDCISEVLSSLLSMGYVEFRDEMESIPREINVLESELKEIK